jgi:hypothetical protein
VTINIAGNFVVGEKPNALEYQFQDASGAPLNLTGYTARFVYREHDGVAVTATASVSDPLNGKVLYTWLGGELTVPGHYEAEFWVGNGSQAYASEKITWPVRLPVGPVPNV